MKQLECKKADDATLIGRALEGDTRAFDALAHRHLPRCYRIARRLGLSPEDAADAVQETFIAAYKALPSFNFNYQFATWLTRILLNRVSNMRRGLARARRFFVKSAFDARDLGTLESTSTEEPDKALERSETMNALQQEIDRLPGAQRTVFILFELEGFKTREIAAMLNIPEGTVTSRLHHARRNLRQKLRHLRSG
ncbi:MAG: sigma-70 family RNA polymerase sigma factor [Calditrichaeota bacterium]|nr:MAG: sigma-70 family RNA polymerase sigma factor [Calditrichota bacterium]